MRLIDADALRKQIVDKRNRTVSPQSTIDVLNYVIRSIRRQKTEYAEATYVNESKEYSKSEMIECLTQIKQEYGHLYMTMFGCTCKVREYVDKIISVICETD